MNLSPKEDSWYFCTNCKPNWRVCGEFNEIFFLIHDIKLNIYLIGDIRGHADSIYEFPSKPTKDPLNLIEEPTDNNDPRWELSSEWSTLVSNEEKCFVFNPQNGYDIYNQFVMGGWEQKKHGYLYLYVVHIAGVLMENYESKIA